MRWFQLYNLELCVMFDAFQQTSQSHSISMVVEHHLGQEPDVTNLGPDATNLTFLWPPQKKSVHHLAQTSKQKEWTMRFFSET